MPCHASCPHAFHRRQYARLSSFRFETGQPVSTPTATAPPIATPLRPSFVTVEKVINARSQRGILTVTRDGINHRIDALIGEILIAHRVNRAAHRRRRRANLLARHVQQQRRRANDHKRRFPITPHHCPPPCFDRRPGGRTLRPRFRHLGYWPCSLPASAAYAP